MPTAIIRAVRRVHTGFVDPGISFDLHIGWMLLAFGFWLLQPGWMRDTFPHIAHEMREVMPIWAWGATLLALGIAMNVSGALGRSTGKWRTSIHLTIYAVVFATWVFLWYFFCWRPSRPPIVGYLAPVEAVFSLLRFLAMPLPPKTQR